MTRTQEPRLRRFGLAILSASLLLAWNGLQTASAQPVPADNAPQAGVGFYSFSIPAGSLADTLNRISLATGRVVSVNPQAVEGKSAPAITGTLSAEAAVARALAGSGLEAVVTPSRAITVRPAAGAGQAATLAPVTVTGSYRHPAVTEGTRSYTTTAVSIGKSERTLREVPQSISVLTRQRMDDQNVTTLGQAMDYVTGVVAQPTGTGIVNIESRGFQINQYLVDGLPFAGGQGMWGSSIMDLGIYDRVEVWRGPTGLLEGAAEPSGTINLVRKRARAEPGFQGAASVGSWDRYRVELDGTGALNDTGTLRARGVMIYDDAGSHLHRVYADRRTLYGTVEYDFTPSTTLSVGGTYQEGDSLVFVGLPQYADGRNIDVPRSTFLGSTDSTKHDNGMSLFAELEHRFDNGGLFRLNASQAVRRTWLNRYMTHSYIDPDTDEVTIRAARQRSRQENQGFDAYFSVPVQGWGLTHEITAGANYQVYRGGNPQGDFIAYRQNIHNPDLSGLDSLPDVGEIPRTKTTQYGVYTQARIKPVQPLTVLLGGRYAWWESRDPDDAAVNQSIKGEFVPYAGLVLDLDDNHSVYASYSRIFSPQTEELATGGFLKPRIGQQYEVGVKGEYLNGALNTHMAVFRIDDRNRAIADPDNEDYSLPAGHVRSQGFEAEISGRMTPQWELTAGYAYTATKFRSGEDNEVGQPYNSAYPRHNFSLWSKYRFAGGPLDRFSVGGGMRWLSEQYVQRGAVRWNQPAYALFDLQLGYEVRPGMNMSLTVYNLFDKTYFKKVSGHEYRQTYFGEPRSVMLTMRGTF